MESGRARPPPGRYQVRLNEHVRRGAPSGTEVREIQRRVRPNNCACIAVAGAAWAITGVDGGAVAGWALPECGGGSETGAWKAARMAWSEAGTTPLYYAWETAFRDQAFHRYS